MPTPRNWFATFPTKTRRVLIAIGLTTLAFIGFTLTVIRDLLDIKNINDLISNSIPIFISILGLIATWLAWKGKTRPAAYVIITGLLIGLFLIPVFTTTSAYATTTEIVVVVVPTIIAIHALSDREFTVTVVLALITRAGIQLVEAFGPATRIFGATTPTGIVAQWVTAIVVVLFGLYIAWNLNSYSFRVKMILVLGILTIVPTTIITNITSRNLESSLIGQANQNLVLSSNQLASAIDLYIQTNLDTTRVDAQIPILEDFIGQQPISNPAGNPVFARGTELERVTRNTLAAIAKKNPINIISVRLLDRGGRIQLSTNQNEIGLLGSAEDYYTVPAVSGRLYMSPVFVSEKGTGIIHFSAPIRTPAGTINGVLDTVYSASVLQQILVRNGAKLGTDVNAMLLDENDVILAHSATPDSIYKIINPPDTRTIIDLIYANRLQNLPPQQLSLQMDGLTLGLKNISKIQYFSGNFHIQQTQDANQSSTSDQAGAAKLSSLNWHIVTFVPQSTLLAPVQKQTQNIVLISILISLISIAIALGLTQVLISPILSLTRTSEQITQGDINAAATVTTQDEIGALAGTFNSMTARVRDLIGSLEQRVAERTMALERRAIQLQAAADVGSTVARLRDLDELMRQVARLISQRFGYYHVGIFLLDERREYAVLRAANSEGGQRMLARGHKLKIGQVGIVGVVAGTGQARIALNVGDDAAFFNNPDLPTTQSEMALPLIVGGAILGALDIQSSQETAFTQEDITTLKVLADQIAIAIENARLFSENQLALETSQRAYGTLSAEGWRHLLGDKSKTVGYVSLAEGQAIPAPENASPGLMQAIQMGQNILENNETILHVPVKIRGLSIGAIRMERPAGKGRWTPETIAMADALSIQLGAALESARLYSDIRQRAEREYIISEITSKLGSSIRLDSILRTAVEELGNAIGDSDIILQVGDQTRKGNERE